MYQTQIIISDNVHKRLLDLSKKLKTKESDIISMAILTFNPVNTSIDRINLLQMARGIWKNRTDLPSPSELRNAWERN